MFLRRRGVLKPTGQVTSQSQVVQVAEGRETLVHRPGSVSDSGCEDSDGLPSGTDSTGNYSSGTIFQDNGNTSGVATKRRKTASGDRAHDSKSRVSSDERKLRKMEQNKNAATRYRRKKQAEVEGILDEEKGLMSKNEELKVKLTDMEREVKCLKSLMRNAFREKGLIK